MKIREDIDIVFCDVDGTLIFWNEKPGRQIRGVPREQFHLHCTKNVELIESLKLWKSLGGKFLAVWSKGGKEHSDWAVNFIAASGYVDATLPKPQMLIDDGPKRWNKGLFITNQLLESEIVLCL